MSIEKDFESLLTDFINSGHSCDDRSGDESCKLKSYTSKGVEYHIPAATGKPQWSFLSMKLTYGGREINSYKAGGMFVEDEASNATNEIRVELEEVYRERALRKDKDIVVALYREGVSQPLSLVTLDPDMPWKCLWKSETQSLTAGNYFVLVANAALAASGEACFDEMGNNQRFTFRVMPHGKGLEHPVVEFLDFDWKKSLSLLIREGKISNLDTFGLYAYNSVGRLMAEVTELPVHEGESQHIRVTLESDEWWLNDEYTLVMTHNNEPFSVFTFQWKNNGIVGCPTSQVLEPDTYYYHIAKLTRKTCIWNSLSDVPGFSLIRKRLLTLLGQKREERVLRCTIASDQRLNYHAVNKLSGMVLPDRYVSELDCGPLVNDMSPFVTELDDVIVLYELAALLTPEGQALLKNIEMRLKGEPQFNLVLWGTSMELKQLFDRSSILSEYIREENRWEVLPFTLTEQFNEFRKQIKNLNLELSFSAGKALIQNLTMHEEQLKEWKEKEIAVCIDKEIVPRFRKRIAESPDFDLDKLYFTTLEEEDIYLPVTVCNHVDFEESLEKLNAMVGLTHLKESLTTTFNRTRFEERRKQFGFPVPERGGHHMIFTGNPGTGKTTVAKLVGRIFHSMGLLSNGEVIEAERTTMVGRYIGETEQNMTELLNKAKGNVLFIDEAYSLCDNSDGDRKDFGCRVLESLLTVLSQKEPDMIVILAGYEKEMNQMLEMNPGMKGRFPYKFNFEDYNADELYQIAFRLLARSEYVLTPEAEALFRETIGETVAHKDAYFHNARWVEQYVWDGIIAAMSDRVMSMPLKVDSKELFQTIQVQDIRQAYQKMKPQPATVTAPRKRIGFVA